MPTLQSVVCTWHAAQYSGIHHGADNMQYDKILEVLTASNAQHCWAAT